MTTKIKAHKIIVKAKNIYLLFDLLLLVIEKNNHGQIESTSLNDHLSFTFWSSDNEYKEIVSTFKNSTFDITIIEEEAF